MVEYIIPVHKVDNLKGQEGLSTEGFHQLQGNDFMVRDEKTGEPLMVVLKAQFNLGPYERACESIKYSESQRSSGLVTTSKIFGFQPRQPTRMRDYCHSSNLALDQPSQHNVLEAGALLVEELYKTYLPEIYESHKLLVEKRIGERWRMNKGIFTSGIVNKDNQLRYHIDSQNMENCWSGMLVLKRGVDGGHLVLPELRAELHLPHGSLVFFNGQKWWHAVTPWKKTQFNGRRYSIVWYTMEDMCKCLSPQEEVARAAKSRTETEFKRLAKQKEKQS